MKQGTTELIKFKKLQRRLGFSKVRETSGLLTALWLLAARDKPRGDIGALDNETIAIALEWDGDPDALICALVETAWLDESSEHRLVVHDWADHAPRFVHGIAAKKGGIIRGEIESPKKPVPDCSGELQSPTIEGDETGDSPGPQSPTPSLFKSIQVKSDSCGLQQPLLDEGRQPGTGSEPSGDKLPDYTEEFEAFWRVYPARDGRKRGKRAAFDLWRKIPAVDHPLVVQAAEHYAKEDYIRDPERFLKKDYWRDYVDGTPDAEGPASSSGQAGLTAEGRELAERNYDELCKSIGTPGDAGLWKVARQIATDPDAEVAAVRALDDVEQATNFTGPKLPLFMSKFRDQLQMIRDLGGHAA